MGALKFELRSVVNSVYAIYFSMFRVLGGLWKLSVEREMTSMLATDVNYGVRFIFELGTCNPPDKGITCHGN